MCIDSLLRLRDSSGFPPDSNFISYHRYENQQIYKLLLAHYIISFLFNKEKERKIYVHIYSFFINNVLYDLSIKKAPKGAVIKIAKTATVKTISPQANPIAKGTPPIAACTVALGI